MLQFLMPDQCPTQWCNFLPTSTGSACASAAYQGIYLFIAMVAPSHLVKEVIYLSSPFLLYLSIKWSCKDYWKRLSITSPRLAQLLSSILQLHFFHCTVLELVLVFSAFTCNWNFLKCFLGFFLYKVNPMDKNLFIRERYQSAWHAVPLINLCCF